MKVRLATPDDLLSVFKMIAKMHTETDFGNVPLNPEKVLQWLNGWIHQGTMWVADADGEAVGVLCWSRKDAWFSDIMFASEDLFYVLPEFRGTRAGYLLMKQFVEHAKNIGAHHCRAGVATGTGAGAERLYQHFGLKHVGGNYVMYFEGN